MSILAKTELNTKYGRFTFNYHESDGEHCLTVQKGNLKEGDVYVRIHSSCLFGETFSAQDCDCRQQLLTAMKTISEKGNGVIVYLFQEGRGVGLENKIKALNVQNEYSKDTVEAFTQLGFALDDRKYDIAISALKDLEVTKNIYLMCNNVRKFNALKSAGYTIKGQVNLSYRVTKEASEYLHIKKEKLQHAINFSQIIIEE